MLEVDRPEPAPGAQVVRDGDRGARAERSESHVGHDVELQVRHPDHARVLDAAVPAAALPRASGDRTTPSRRTACRDAVTQEHLGEPDPGDVVRGDDPGQQPEPAVASRPLPGFRTPSASSGDPGAGVMTTPARVSR